jgi:hypothetical protein
VNVVNVYNFCNVLFSNLSGETEENHKISRCRESSPRAIRYSSAVYASLKWYEAPLFGVGPSPHVWSFFSPTMAQQPLVSQGLLVIEASRSHSGTPHSVGLLRTCDQPDTETST